MAKDTVVFIKDGYSFIYLSCLSNTIVFRILKCPILINIF